MIELVNILKTSGQVKIMMEQIKTGKQVIDEFFNELQQLPNVDEKTALIFLTLHRDGKLTAQNIENDLRKLRDEAAK